MKRIQFTTRYKGGGGTVTNETIPAWARPYIENVGNAAETQYGSGSLGRVAGVSDLQKEAFTTGAGNIKSTTESGINALQGTTNRLEDMARTGTGFTGGETLKAGAAESANKAIAEGARGFGTSGTLGSTRQAIANQVTANDLAAKFAGIDYDIAKENAKTKLAAEQGIGSAATGAANLATSGTAATANLGGQERTIEQQQADADWQALNRYASTIYGNPARQQTTAVPGGK